MSTENLLTKIPDIHNCIEMRQWLKPLYIIEDYMENYTSYSIFLTKTYNVLRGCFTIRACRNAPIRFKMRRDSSEEYELPFRMFIINTILWYPFVELHGLDVLDSNYILSDPELIPGIEKWINEKLISVLNEYHIKTADKNRALSEVLNYLRKISMDYSTILGVNFSIPLFIKLYEENSEIKDLMETTFPEYLQPNEIEEQLGVKQQRFIDIVSSMQHNHLGLLLRAKTGIKPKQLSEFAISEGMKPNLTGETIPIVIQNSTLLKGTNKPSYMYIDALASRKSLIMNKKVMGTAGAFCKRVLTTARTLSLSKVVSDCGSTHLVPYRVSSPKILKKLYGKFYKLDNNSSEDFKVVKLNDTFLIGRTIYARSAATCACKKNYLTGQDEVCAKCVGLTASNNADLAEGFSAFESEEYTKSVNQNILSSKHLMTTRSEEIKFNDDFYCFFTLVGSEITPRINDSEIDNIDDYAIVVDMSEVVKVDEQDEDSLYNTSIPSGKFYIRNLENPEEQDILISCDKEIFVPGEISTLLHKNKGIIRFSSLEDSTVIFEVVILNNELTKPLYDLMYLIDRQNHDEPEMTIEYISNRFLELLVEAGISASVVAGEITINRLIRRADNIYERPDFSKETEEPYVIITVSQSLEKNPSPLIGMTYQDHKRQLLSEDFFTVRTSPSYVDPLFDPVVRTDSLKVYNQYGLTDKTLFE